MVPKRSCKRAAPHAQNNRSIVATLGSPMGKILRNNEVNKQNSIYLIIQCSFCSPSVSSLDVTKEHSFLIKYPQIFHLQSDFTSRFNNRFWIEFYSGIFSFLKPFYRGCCTESHLRFQIGWAYKWRGIFSSQMLRLTDFANSSNVTSIFTLEFGFGTSTLTMVLLIVPPLYQEKPQLFGSYGSVFAVTTVVHTAAQST